jgi:sulfatase maturation enzyme AslB (radical SAM superfamily)
MSWETLEPALDLVLRSQARDVTVRFIGGEPLLETPLMRRAVSYVRERSPPGRVVTYSISTNGLLLDDETVEFLARNAFETQLSFDGIPEAQDIRGRGTHRKLDALLDHLRESFGTFYRLNLHIGVTLHSGNLRYLARSIEYFLAKGIRSISIGPLLSHDPGWRLDDIDELNRQFERIFDLSRAHLRRTGKVPLEVFKKTGTQHDHHRPSGESMCGAPRGDGIAVDVDGQVTGCVTFAESYQRLPTEFLKSRLDSMRMGKVRDLEFRRRLALYPEAARAAGIFHDKASKHSSYRRCRDCEYLRDCTICPTSIGHLPGNSDPHRVPDLGCAYNLIAFKYRARFPRQSVDANPITGTSRKRSAQLGRRSRRPRVA